MFFSSVCQSNKSFCWLSTIHQTSSEEANIVLFPVILHVFDAPPSQRTPCSSLGCHQGSFYRAFVGLRWGRSDGDAPIDDLTGLSSTGAVFFPLKHPRLCSH